jgi:hypothetical protein
MDLLGGSGATRPAGPSATSRPSVSQRPARATRPASEDRLGSATSPRSSGQESVGKVEVHSLARYSYAQDGINFQLPGASYLGGATRPFFPTQFPAQRTGWPGQAAQPGVSSTFSASPRKRARPPAMQLDISDPLRWLLEHNGPVDRPVMLQYGPSGSPRVIPIIAHVVPSQDHSSTSYTLAQNLGINQWPGLPGNPGDSQGHGSNRLPGDFINITLVHAWYSCGFPEIKLNLRLEHRHDRPVVSQAWEIWLGRDALRRALAARMQERAEFNAAREAMAGGFLGKRGLASQGKWQKKQGKLSRGGFLIEGFGFQRMLSRTRS